MSHKSYKKTKVGDESSCKNLNKSLTKYDEKDTTFINT
jgi:hypothetical protein